MGVGVDYEFEWAVAVAVVGLVAGRVGVADG